MICLEKSKNENDFFVAEHYSNYFCVTNTTYALSWTTTEVDEKLEQGIVRVTGHHQYPATAYYNSTEIKHLVLI
jgi:hypothetical protein